MDINYYWYEKQPCECCGRSYEPLHVGGSSLGWTFQLHVMPEKGINSLEDWKKLWEIEGSCIANEHGRRISIEEMEDEITNRRCALGIRSSDWYMRNSAEGGPNNLVRSIVDGVHCVGHGEGTWDHIVGEFS